MRGYRVNLYAGNQAYELSVSAEGALRLGRVASADNAPAPSRSNDDESGKAVAQVLSFFVMARLLTVWIAQEKPFELTVAGASLRQQAVFERLARRIQKRLPWYDIYEIDGVLVCCRRIDRAGDRQEPPTGSTPGVREDRATYDGCLRSGGKPQLRLVASVS